MTATYDDFEAYYADVNLYDVKFTAAGIELISMDDDSVKIVPHIPASRALAEGDENFPFQERDIALHMEENGYVIIDSIYNWFPTAQPC